jgi:hypothetical protein
MNERPLSPLLFNVVHEFLVRKIKQEKKIKVIQIGKKVELFLFTNNINPYIKDPKDYQNIQFDK